MIGAELNRMDMYGDVETEDDVTQIDLLSSTPDQSTNLSETLADERDSLRSSIQRGQTSTTPGGHHSSDVDLTLSSSDLNENDVQSNENTEKTNANESNSLKKPFVLAPTGVTAAVAVAM